jgi:hypothetical protein
VSWVRLDDRFDENPKQLRMSNAGFRLYVCALSFCARHRDVTGFMTYEQANGLRRAIRQGPKTIGELVALNAWEQVDGGYLIHDYEDYIEKGSRERTRLWRARVRESTEMESKQTISFRSNSKSSQPVENSSGSYTGDGFGDVTETPLARDGYPVPVPVLPPYPPQAGDGDSVTDEGSQHDGLTRIDRASLGTLLDQARANRAEAGEAKQA